MSIHCDAPGLMPLEEALNRICDTVKSVTATEICTVDKARGRVTAEAIVSPIDVPAFDNSAMDGYAVCTQNIDIKKTLKQVGFSFAGQPFEGVLKAGECVRIMTGGVIPEGADAVVMQENTQADGESIGLVKAPKKGEAIRVAGSDIRKDCEVVSAGKLLSPVDIGLLASLGLKTISVYKRLTVAIFSTGDELLEAGEAPRPGCIYDSNRAMLAAMLEQLHCEIIDLGRIPDDKALIEATLHKAQFEADVIITTGGVSVGEADFTKAALESMGEVGFWKIAMKPGKPLAFGRLPEAIFFGLPGNPVSAAATFVHVVQPAISIMTGSSPKQFFKHTATAAKSFRKRPGRIDFQRANCWIDSEGNLMVEPFVSQSSGVLSSFSQTNCFAILEQDRGTVSTGEEVIVQLYDGLLN